jgi:hypothetical protein
MHLSYVKVWTQMSYQCIGIARTRTIIINLDVEVSTRARFDSDLVLCSCLLFSASCGLDLILEVPPQGYECEHWLSISMYPSRLPMNMLHIIGIPL